MSNKTGKNAHKKTGTNGKTPVNKENGETKRSAQNEVTDKGDQVDISEEQEKMEQPSPDKDAPEEKDIKKEAETKDQIPENDTEKSAGKTSEAEADKEKAEADKEKAEADEGKTESDEEKAEADEGKTESDEEKAEGGKKGRTHDVPRARKKGFIKKHGKTVLILAVLLFVVFIIFRIYSVQKAVQEIASIPEPEFRDVERRDISNSIAVTATVEADDKRTVSTLVSNTKVLDVYYEVGDYVQEGDIICTFDTSNVSENIARLRKKMNVTSAKNQVAVNDAHVEVDKAGTTWAYNGQDNMTSIDRTHDTYNRAMTEYNVACEDYSDAVKTKDKRRDEYHEAKDNYERWESEYDDLPEDVKTGSVSGNEEQQKIKINYKYYADLYNSAQTAYNTAKKAVETAEADVRTKDASVESARQKIEDADKKYPRDLLSDGVTVQTKQRSEYVASLDASIANQENEKTMSEYEHELEESVVVAPISGMVTALNVHRGDEFAEKSKTDVCVIQDDSGYTVKGNVDQYNISSVIQGMRALIKTEATGDEILEGIVKFVSPVPAKTATVASQSSTSNSDSKSEDSTKVSYPVEITLMTKDPRLRLGMTAETSLVVNERDQVLVVPYDCVAQDENGYKCVYVEIEDPHSDDEEEEETSLLSGLINLFVMPEAEDEVKTRKVIVQTGLETDYYIEIISDEIKEGDRVKVPDGNDGTGSSDTDGSDDGSYDDAAMKLVPDTDDVEPEEGSEGVSAGAGGI